ncbi:MAG: lysylphosphatidylglycerol synthase transmembrane domain-containing protein [Cyanobacteria bacterium P01_F01_bin.86]
MKRLISIAISLCILALLYWQIELDRLIEVFQASDRRWMIASLGMVVPITLFTAQRLRYLMPPQQELPFWEANRLILAASVLNMVLPSKAGDIAKAYFMRDRGHLNGSLALSLVVFEKACDMLSLLLWCLFGLLIYTPKDALFGWMTVGILGGFAGGTLLLGSTQFAHVAFGLGQRLAPQKLKIRFKQLEVAWAEMHTYFWHDKQRLRKVVGSSIFIWLLHLLQIWFFILALKAWVPFLTSLALSPLAILAGLLPLTFAGVGTRDAALIWLYAPYFDKAIGAALGLLCTSRYFLPAIGGLPFLENYLRMTRTNSQ